MPAEVTDLHRTWADRIVRAVWERQLVQTSRMLRQGQTLTLVCPNLDVHGAAEQLIAEFDEMRRLTFRQLAEQETTDGQATEREDQRGSDGRGDG